MTTKTNDKKPKEKKTVTKSKVSKNDSKCIEKSVESSTDLIVEVSKDVVETLPSVSDLETLKETIEETTEQLVSSNVNNDVILDGLSTLLIKCDTLEKECRSTKVDLRKIMKLYEKKYNKQKRKYSSPRAPSGFAKPSLLSVELCKFLKLPSGSKLARTDVTKEINKYIKLHNLQDDTNRRKIKPDKSLCNVLKVDSKIDNLTYFSIQTYLNDHLSKDNTTVVV